MKKIALLALICTVLSTSCKDKPKFESNDGVINFLSGSVFIVNEGKSVKASVGAMVNQGVQIKTGSRALVDIYFGKNVIRILGNSLVTMKELSREINKNKEYSEFYVEKGKLFSRVTRKLTEGERFIVSTPTAIAGVRGTEFFVEEGKGKSRVSCLEGKVAVKKPGEDEAKSVYVEAGREAVVDQDNAISVDDMKKENLANIRRIKDEIKGLREDIRERFEKQRNEIRQQVIDMKSKNKENVENQKAQDKENIKKIKEETKVKAEEIKADTDTKKEEAKDAVKQFKKPDIKGVKPDIKKFKTGD